MKGGAQDRMPHGLHVNAQLVRPPGIGKKTKARRLTFIFRHTSVGDCGVSHLVVHHLVRAIRAVDNQRQIDGARLWLNPPQTCATLRLAGLTFFRAAAPDDVEHGSSGKKHHVQRVRFSRCNSNACENAACRRVKKAIGKMLHQPRHSLQTGWFVQHDQLRVFITISIPDGLLAVSLLAITEFQATVKKIVFAGPTTENRRWFVKP